MKRSKLPAGLGQAVRVCLFSVVLLVLVIPAADAAAIRYWVKRYNGPADDVDSGAAVAFDKFGNAYVAGRSTAGGSGSDYLVIKYGPNGGVKWMKRYDGTGNNWDGARGIAVDDNGNVYVTGRSFGPHTHGDYATIKYDAAGRQKWVKRYTSAGYYDDGAMDIALDSFGNVIVTGFSTGPGSAFDYVTIKYGPDGSQKWLKRYDGPGNAGDVARGVAVDANNNVYVTGASNGVSSSWDYATVKYSPTGVQLWVKRWNSPFNASDGATDIAMDDYNFAYVTGYTYRGGSNSDYMTIKYNRNGTIKWAKRYNGPANGADVAWAIDVYLNGVFVTGASLGRGTDTDYATIRYFRGGDRTWVRRYSGPARKADVANAIVAENGRVYVTGYSTGAVTSGDYLTIAYGGGGGLKWANRYNGPASAFDQGNAVGVCPVTGNVYVTGGSGGNGTKSDFATIKYAP
jgi:hypothetical protein